MKNELYIHTQIDRILRLGLIISTISLPENPFPSYNNHNLQMRASNKIAKITIAIINLVLRHHIRRFA